MKKIQIINAYEGNLKHISLEIPKNQFVVFTGVSGSGKSTLLVDVLFNECQRLYLEAMTLQGIRKPKVDRVQSASPSILITQDSANHNPRSTVGTLTNVYTDLRMIYEKLGVRTCPYCNAVISAADCKEETEKIGQDFHVYMYCSHCGKRMDKITRSHFSFNTKQGACPTCEGLGKVHVLKKENVVDENLSLEQGAVSYWEKQYGKYQISVLYAAYQYLGLSIPKDIPVHQFSEIQKAILYDGFDCSMVQENYPNIKPPKNVMDGRFEGVYPILWHRFHAKEGSLKGLEPYFEVVDCLDCHGERLNELSRNVCVNGVRLPEISQYTLEHLMQWITELKQSLSSKHIALVEDYFLDIETKLNRYLQVGLSYLTLDRQMITLSKGELQRARLAAVLDSDLSGLIYILDEPTAGLHPKDTMGLIAILKKLRDLGNSVFVIEHDVDVMESADYIVDIGPGCGKQGGEVVVQGTPAQIKQHQTSKTAEFLRSKMVMKERLREPKGWIQIENAKRYNLKNLNVNLAIGCLNVVSGASGSGKSTLIFDVLASQQAKGLENFDQMIEITQSAITRMKRSNIATYSGVYSEIRHLFAKSEDAQKANLSAKHFSFNTAGGRCENCEGLGVVENNMLFFANNEITCPMCQGNRFQPHILDIKIKGLSIKEVLDLSIDEALTFFADQKKIVKILTLLMDVGLGYLQLGQTLTTLSKGEGQRLKLAKELTQQREGNRNLYLMDEPTSGLHPKDIEHFLILLNRMVDVGHTIVVVEHNQQLILNSDWVVDLGPEGGDRGGELIFNGNLHEFIEKKEGITSQCLNLLL